MQGLKAYLDLSEYSRLPDAMASLESFMRDQTLATPNIYALVALKRHVDALRKKNLTWEKWQITLAATGEILNRAIARASNDELAVVDINGPYAWVASIPFLIELSDCLASVRRELDSLGIPNAASAIAEVHQKASRMPREAGACIARRKPKANKHLIARAQQFRLSRK